MSYDTKVPVPASKPAKQDRQPLVGKIGKDMGSMPGSSGKGQAVSTVKSNPIQGKNVQGNTAMGSGGIINGKV